MSKAKRDPVIIDVKPDELHRESERVPLDSIPRDGRRLKSPTVAQQMRELQRAGRAVQTPDFWFGVLVDLWRNRQ